MGRSTAMFVPQSQGVGIVFVLLCLPAWGLWPFIRSKCGAAVPAFAPLNASAQFCMALLWGFTLGEIEGSGNNETFLSDLSQLFQHIDLRVLCVLGGGFLLGHSDH